MWLVRSSQVMHFLTLFTRMACCNVIVNMSGNRHNHNSHNKRNTHTTDVTAATTITTTIASTNTTTTNYSHLEMQLTHDKQTTKSLPKQSHRFLATLRPAMESCLPAESAPGLSDASPARSVPAASPPTTPPPLDTTGICEICLTPMSLADSEKAKANHQPNVCEVALCLPSHTVGFVSFDLYLLIVFVVVINYSSICFYFVPCVFAFVCVCASSVCVLSLC
jgi:hypothetical protein